MVAWRIRKAEPSDAAELAASIAAAYAAYAETIDDLPDVAADISDEIARHQVWVAEGPEGIAGGLVLVPRDGFMQLANVAVHPDRRGTGLGRALMARAEAEARHQGYLEMRLSTHVRMPENVRLYSHLGWEETGRPGNKVTMRKRL